VLVLFASFCATKHQQNAVSPKHKHWLSAFIFIIHAKIHRLVDSFHSLTTENMKVASQKTKLVETTSKVVLKPEEILALTKEASPVGQIGLVDEMHDSATSIHTSKPGVVLSSNPERASKEHKEGSNGCASKPAGAGVASSSETERRSSKELEKESNRQSKPTAASAAEVFDDIVSSDGSSFISVASIDTKIYANERQDSKRVASSSPVRVRKQAPGAVSVEGICTPDVSSDLSFNDYESIREEHNMDESLNAKVELVKKESTGESTNQEDGTVTATAIARDDLEQELRARIFAEAVEAQVMATQEPKPKNSRKWLIMRCIIFLLVIAVAVVLGAVAATSGGNNDDSSASSEEGGQDDTHLPIPTAAPPPIPTAAPTELVLTDAQQEVLDSFVLVYPDEEADALSDRSSPQFKAFLWILQTEPEDLRDSPSRQEILLSRYAMATLYHSTGGESWTESENWLTTLHVCEWYPKSETQCDEDRNVVELKLPGNNLNGTLPAELVFLSTLERLDLSNNEIEGRLPNPWGERNVFRNNLKELKLSQNSLTGSIPIGYSKLEKLEVLELGKNQLSGEIASEIGILAKLRVLDLGGPATNMTGIVPEEIWRLPNLRRINLNGLGLMASLPTAIQQATGLEIMQLNSNFLSGSIPTSIGILTNLRVMDVANNLLAGSLPSEIGNLHETLQKLLLRENSIGGSVPTEVGTLTKLVSLDFAECYFSGGIPAEIFRLSVLIVLNAENNVLDGAIPTEIALFSDLEVLSLGQNQMTGEIPSEIGLLGNLQVFSAGDGLFGTIPRQLGSATSLRTLSLADNALEGPIPTAFSQLSNLRVLELQGNQLTSTLPAGFELLSNLGKFQHTDRWQRKGPSISQFSLLVASVTFNLYDNLLTGSLPVEYATSWTAIGKKQVIATSTTFFFISEAQSHS
jgi:Leucine-rich repeat (LRR) protein